MPAVKRTSSQMTKAKASTVAPKVARSAAKSKKLPLYGNLKNVNYGKGLAQSATIKHKYCQFVQFASVITGLYKFSANGMFKPDQTNGAITRQPMMFDQMSALYNHYTVTASKIKVVYHQPQTSLTTTAVPAICYTTVDDDSTPSGTIYAEVEQPQVYGKIVGTDGTPLTTYGYFNAATQFDVKDPVAVDKLRGTPAAQPPDQTYFVVKYWNVDQVSLGNIINMWIEIEYTATWTELKTITSS